MPHDAALADRIRDAVKGMKDVTEKAMFGGVAWMRRGNMFVGTMKDELFVRVGKALHHEAIKRPHARTADFMHRPMEGFILVGPPAIASVTDVRDWANFALTFVDTLPAKKAKPAGATKAAKVATRTKTVKVGRGAKAAPKARRPKAKK
jgi:hypothetical protein